MLRISLSDARRIAMLLEQQIRIQRLIREADTILVMLKTLQNKTENPDD